nr:MAG TPA: hypothetical protein [Caudoviricetes sp.]
MIGPGSHSRHQFVNLLISARAIVQLHRLFYS